MQFLNCLLFTLLFTNLYCNCDAKIVVSILNTTLSVFYIKKSYSYYLWNDVEDVELL